MIYRYYVLTCPFTVSSMPKGFVNHHNFYGSMYIASIHKKAYGYVDYDHPIQPIDREKYGLTEEFMPR